MKVVIPGGSGQVGALLARAFQHDGHDVVVLSREPQQTPWRVVQWDARTVADWARELDGADVVINLAGRNVNCRYNSRNRREIMESRMFSTRAVGEAIAGAQHPPRVWLQASTATIYAHRYDAPNDEESGWMGGAEQDAPDTWQFSTQVAKAWEEAFYETHTPTTRKIAIRSAMTMSPDTGGVFDVLLRLVRFGLGGKAGDGRQYVSWVHEADFVRSLFWLIENETITGAVNVCAPCPLPNAEFMRALRRAWGIPIGLPATKWMLEIGAKILGTETELVLKSRRVVPGRLLESGFVFDYPTWPEAARELCQRWKIQQQHTAPDEPS